MRNTWKVFLTGLVIFTGMLGSVGAEPEQKPVLGVCVVETDALRAEKNVKPGEWLRDMVERKIPAGKYQRSESVNPADFVTFLSKKDITSDSSGLFKELRLPTLVDFGKDKNVDFLLVIIGDASVMSHMGTKIVQYTDSDNKVRTTAHEEMMIDYADVKLRASLVDVRKNEYIFNTVFTRRSGEPDPFANAVRSVVNDGMKKVLAEFNQKIVIP